MEICTPLPPVVTDEDQVLGSLSLHVLTLPLAQIQTQVMLLVELTQVTAVEFQYRYTICKTLEDALTPFFPGLYRTIVRSLAFLQKLIDIFDV